MLVPGSAVFFIAFFVSVYRWLEPAPRARDPTRGALMDLIASHFLAGSVLTLVMPVGLFVLVCIYWAIVLRRRSGGGA